LWDQLEKVDARFVALSGKNDQLVRFLREKAQLDQEYCTKLRKLSNKYEKLANSKETKYSTENAFSQLLSGTSMIANQYEQIGEEIISTCVQPFHQFNGEFNNKRKDLRAEYARNMKQLDECGKEMDKSKENWISKFKNSEKAKQQYEKADQDDHVTKADVEKARVNKEQKRTLAEDAKNEYARALVKCNEQQRTHHTKLVPNILSRYQSEFLSSSDTYCSTVVNYCKVEEKFRPLMTSCLGDIESKANDINGQVDADGYVDEFKTGYHPPEDIPFEDIEQQGQNQHSSRLTLGGLFSRHKKAPEKPAQEDMSHLPPEQQKRELKRMKKEVEKELDKTRKELKALEKMQNLAKSNSKMGDPESYNTKINEVNNRIQQQERRINQINNWLGEKTKSVEPDRTRSPPNFPLSGTTTKTTAAASSDKIVYAEPKRLGNNRLDSFDEDSSFDSKIEAECLYEFVDDGDGCIHIKPGQRLLVTEQDTGDGWTKVKEGSMEGFVPTSYIKLL